MRHRSETVALQLPAAAAVYRTECDIDNGPITPKTIDIAADKYTAFRRGASRVEICKKTC